MQTKRQEAVHTIVTDVIEPLKNSIGTPILFLGCGSLGLGAVASVAMKILGFSALSITAVAITPVSIGLFAIGAWAVYEGVLAMLVRKVVSLVDAFIELFKKDLK